MTMLCVEPTGRPSKWLVRSSWVKVTGDAGSMSSSLRQSKTWTPWLRASLPTTM
jgi:hypothetical protein